MLLAPKTASSASVDRAVRTCRYPRRTRWRPAPSHACYPCPGRRSDCGCAAQTATSSGSSRSCRSRASRPALAWPMSERAETAGYPRFAESSTALAVCYCCASRIWCAAAGCSSAAGAARRPMPSSAVSSTTPGEPGPWRGSGRSWQGSRPRQSRSRARWRRRPTSSAQCRR